MARKDKLFELVVPEDKLHPFFAHVRTSEVSISARAMLEDVFADFHDPDGNFVEQFQTTGFDNRFFELYLHAFFGRSGYVMDRRFPNPDFLVERDGEKVAVEATTINPSTSGVISKYGKKIEELDESELSEYTRDELPIRFGSALFSKLQKAYWTKPHCTGLPFVIAVQAFHDKGSLHFSDTSLVEYAYGRRHTAEWTPEGDLLIKSRKVEAHSLGEKTIPSGFFEQPDTQHVSALLFSNSGTHAKFARMGYQSGFGSDVLKIRRFGRSFDESPDAMDSVLFDYDMDDPPLVEPWGQGLVVVHNPKATIPLPRGFFVNANEHRLRDGRVVTLSGGWHPFSSTTLLVHVGKLKSLPNARMLMGHGPRAIGAIHKDHFWSFQPQVEQDGEEDGWFADEFSAFLGLVLRREQNWKALVLARDFTFKFFPIAKLDGIESRLSAVNALQHKMMSFLDNPRRLFNEPVG